MTKGIFIVYDQTLSPYYLHTHKVNVRTRPLLVQKVFLNNSYYYNTCLNSKIADNNRCRSRHTHVSHTRPSFTNISIRKRLYLKYIFFFVIHTNTLDLTMMMVTLGAYRSLKYISKHLKILHFYYYYFNICACFVHMCDASVSVKLLLIVNSLLRCV